MAYARQLRLRLKLALVQAELKATTESPLKVPVRLLPAALEAVAFMAIWTGFTRPVKVRRNEIAKRRGAMCSGVAGTGGKAEEIFMRAVPIGMKMRHRRRRQPTNGDGPFGSANQND
jgi:hypothetical protein